MAGRGLIDAVWDDTARVLGERGRRIAPAALLAFALPPVAQAAVPLVPLGGPAGTSVVALLMSILGLMLSLWGGLVVIGLASDPVPGPTVARVQAGRRLPASLLVAAVLFAGLLLLSLPLGVVAAFSGLDMAAMSRGAMPAVPAGGGRTLFLALLIVLAVIAWAGARLLPTQAVVLHERRGLGALSAAFRSTRGLALRLIGAELVFVLVALVAGLAVRTASGTLLLLLFGPERLALALFVAAVLSALVSAALVSAAWVFVARLYQRLGTAPAGSPPGTIPAT